MSHFTNIKTCLKDKACLVKALETLGIKAVLCTQNTVLRDYRGNATKSKVDVICTREQFTCTYGRNNACSDIGFAFDSEGNAELIADMFNNTTLSKIASDSNKLAQKIAQEYAVARIYKQAAAKGKTVHRVQEGEKVRLYVNA